MSGTDLDTLKDRIRALRQMTIANGCTEAEAMTAAAMAAKLLERHGLTDADLDLAEVAVPLGRKCPLARIWPMIGAFTDCLFLFRRDSSSGTIVRDGVYYGLPHNVLVAEFIHDVIQRACDTAIAGFKRTPDYTRCSLPKTRANALRAFKEGLATRLSQKLADGLWQRHDVGAADHVQHVRAHLAEQVGKQNKVRKAEIKIKSAPGQYRSARVAGYAAGDAIDVHAGVGGTTPLALTAPDTIL